MTKGLSEFDRALLRRILSRWNPVLVDTVNRLGEAESSVELRELLREAVASELASNGLDNRSEHTPYGVTLEDLIDKLGHV